jgi:hypothetical protein
MALWGRRALIIIPATQAERSQEMPSLEEMASLD